VDKGGFDMKQKAFFLLSVFSSIALAVFMQGGGSNPEDVSKSEILDSSGGVISLSSREGYTISLTIPENTLKKPTEIIMTSVKTKLENPIQKNIFPGLRIEPENFLLNEGATLEIDFNQKIPSSACVFVILQDDFIIPIAGQTVEAESGVISGKIYYFKNYAAGVPTEQEIVNQVKKARIQEGGRSKISQIEHSNPFLSLHHSDRKNMRGVMSSGWGDGEGGALGSGSGVFFQRKGPSGACFGWRGTYTTIQGLLTWSERLMALGNEAADEAMRAAEEVLEQDIESFLNREVPANPCGNYLKAAIKYAELAILLGLSNEKADAIQNRVEELLDQCTMRFSIEIENIARKESDEKEYINSYGSVIGHVPYSNFLKGDLAVEGEGTLSYDYKYRWRYQDAQNCVLTKNASGTIKVTIPHGYLYMKEAEAGKHELWLNTHLAFQNDAKGTGCDTCREGNPCQDFVDDHKWSNILDLPLKNGAQMGSEKTDAERKTYVKVMYTLHILHMPSDSDDSDDDCY